MVSQTGPLKLTLKLECENHLLGINISKNQQQRNGRASQVALVIKNPPTNAGVTRDMGSIHGSGRSPGGGHDNPLQQSCLENPIKRNLASYSSWGCKDSDTTEWLRHTHTHTHTQKWEIETGGRRGPCKSELSCITESNFDSVPQFLYRRVQVLSQRRGRSREFICCCLVAKSCLTAF